MASPSSAWVRSTVRASVISWVSTGRLASAAVRNSLLVSSSDWRLVPWPLNTWPSSSTSVRREFNGTDRARSLTLVSRLVTGAGTVASASVISEPPCR